MLHALDILGSKNVVCVGDAAVVRPYSELEIAGRFVDVRELALEPVA